MEPKGLTNKEYTERRQHNMAIRLIYKDLNKRNYGLQTFLPRGPLGTVANTSDEIYYKSLKEKYYS